VRHRDALPDLAAQEAALLQIREDLFTRLEAIESLIDAGVPVHPAVRADDRHQFEAVALAHLKIVEIVGRSDLDRAAAEGRIGVFVGDDGDGAIDQRQEQLFTDQMLIAFIGGVDGHRGVAEHGLGPGGGDDDLALTLRERIGDIPEFALLIDRVDLFIGQCGAAARAPVDQTVALVNQSFFIEADKDLTHRLAQPLVHGEAFTLPVAGGAELAELLEDDAAVFFPPLPDALEEPVAAEGVAGLPLEAQRRLDLVLGGDAGMIGARHPQGLVALHFFPADEEILDRVIEDMAHGEHAGHVGRRDHDRIGVFGGPGIGVEQLVLFPESVPAVFHQGGIIGFFEFARAHGETNLSSAWRSGRSQSLRSSVPVRRMAQAVRVGIAVTIEII